MVSMLFLIALLQLSYSPAKGQNVRIIPVDSNSDQRNQPPPSPCPQSFRYQYGSNGWTGIIAVPPPTNVDVNVRHLLPVRLEVRLRVSGVLPTKYVGKLELAESKEVVLQKVLEAGSSRGSILYRLYFPTTSPLPYLNLITLNGNLICSGNSDLTPGIGRVLTAITLEHTFYPSANSLTTGGGFNSGVNDYSGGSNNNFGNQQFGSSYGADNGNNFNGGSNPFGNGGLNVRNQNPIRTNVNTGGRPSAVGNNYNAGNTYFGGQSAEGVYQPAGGNNFNVPVLQGGDSNPGTNNFNTGGENNYETGTNFGSNHDQTEGDHPIRQNPSQNSFFINFLQGQDRNCGKPLASNLLVVKGEPVTKRGEWPWVVAIFENIPDGVGIKFHCSGSLISKHYVLTAAHCTRAGNVELTPDRLLLYLGKFNLNKWTESGAQAREVKHIHKHPNYGSNGGVGSDLAVLELSERAEYSPFVQPACIWPWKTSKESGGDADFSDLGPLIGKLGTVVGWGRDENGNKVTSEPRLTKVPVVSQEECLRSGQSYTYLTSNRTFCAGFRNGTGPCNGDSGGGLMFPVSDDEDGSATTGRVRWFLRGIVSLSLLDSKTHTCDLDNYVVFTDIAKYGEWISDFIDLDLLYSNHSARGKLKNGQGRKTERSTTEEVTTESSWLKPIPFRSLQSSQEE